jgi:hypothetical protein
MVIWLSFCFKNLLFYQILKTGILSVLIILHCSWHHIHVHVVEITICNLFEDIFIVHRCTIKDCYYGLRLRFSIKKVILKFCLCLLFYWNISLSAESKSIQKKINYQAIDNRVDELKECLCNL